MLRLLIGDTNLLIRTGIRTILAETRAVVEVGEAMCGTEVMEKLRLQAWSLCILDMALPERGSVEIARHVRKARDKTPVLILCSRSDRQHAGAAIRGGAKGVVSRDCTREEFLLAVSTVITSGRYVGPQFTGFLASQDDDRLPYERLSQRELQILRKLALGISLIAISKELSISPKSVSTYRARILEKTQCRNNAEIIRYAIRESLI